MQKGHAFRFTLLFDRLTMSLFSHRKIPKISPGASIFQRPILRGLFLEGLYSEGLIYRGKFAFLNRLGYSLIVGSKFTVFALFYFVFDGNFPSTSPPGGGGLIFGGAI